MNYWIVWLSIVSNNLLNSFFSFKISIMLALNKYITNICSFNWFFSNLNLSTWFLLKFTDCFTIFSYYKTNNVVWNWNDVGVLRRRSIGSHHALLKILICILDLLCDLSGFVQLLGDNQLFMSDLLSCLIISRYDSFNCYLSFTHWILVVSNQ
jgi:hypothetical protein